MARYRRRKVFVSYHHRDDQEYKDRFVRMMSVYIVDKSVDTGDIIDQDLPVDEVRRRIRDEYIADATVTVVLIGRCTWQRKHVDWEISASLIDTPHNDRCGLLGIRLPTHTDFSDAEYNPRLIPPRLAANCEGNDPLRRFIVGRGARTRSTGSGSGSTTPSLGEEVNPTRTTATGCFARNRHTDYSRGWQS